MSGEKISNIDQTPVSYFIRRDGRTIGRIEWFEDIGFESLIEKMRNLFRERPEGIEIYEIRR